MTGGDRGALTLLARGLTRCVGLQCCCEGQGAQGMRFTWVVAGAFSEPPVVSFPWPQDPRAQGEPGV